MFGFQRALKNTAEYSDDQNQSHSATVPRPPRCPICSAAGGFKSWVHFPAVLPRANRGCRDASSAESSSRTTTIKRVFVECCSFYVVLVFVVCACVRVCVCVHVSVCTSEYAMTMPDETMHCIMALRPVVRRLGSALRAV